MLLLSSQSTGRRRRSGDSLLVDLISWWSQDEASGTRFDAHGSNHLTDNNTVGSAAGKVGNAASFVAASQERLSHATNSSLEFADEDFTIAAWIRQETLSQGAIVCKGTLGSNTSDEYALWFTMVGGGQVRFYVGNLVDVSGKAIASLTTAGVWHLVVGWHDSTANTVNVQVDNGTVVSASYAGGCAPSSQAFTIGSTRSPAVFFNGLIDEVPMWRRKLTGAERTRLYNSGNGIAYPG